MNGIGGIGTGDGWDRIGTMDILYITYISNFHHLNPIASHPLCSLANNYTLECTG